MFNDLSEAALAEALNTISAFCAQVPDDHGLKGLMNTAISALSDKRLEKYDAAFARAEDLGALAALSIVMTAHAARVAKTIQNGVDEDTAAREAARVTEGYALATAAIFEAFMARGLEETK